MFLETLFKKLMTTLNVDDLDEETTRMVERMAVLRVATKHINLWMRQLEMKRGEIIELARLMGLDEIKKEIEEGKDLEGWAKKCSHHFTKKIRRMLFEETDNMIWSGVEKELAQWCKKNKVYDEITEDEIEEIWKREEDPNDDEPIRLNGKYVWETAKRVCDFVTAHEDLIRITTFSEYRVVMRKMMRVIREAHNVERKRRQLSRKERKDESKTRRQKAKSLIAEVRRGGMRKDEIENRLEKIFGVGSSQEIEKATTKEKIVERIEEMSKREEQFDEWEKMRQGAKRRQREDRRMNLFWRRNKTFPAQYGGDEDTPGAEETLEFWRSINNKEVCEGWREDESIQMPSEECERNSNEEGADGVPSLKRSLMMSSDAQLRGRRAVLTRYIPSQSRDARPTERPFMNW